MEAKLAGDDLLRDAIVRNSALVLSLPSEGMVRHYKSRFLAEGTEPGSFIVESAPNEKPLIDACVNGGNLVGISFKSGDQKVVFATRVTARVPDFKLSADVAVEALTMVRPSDIKAVQRRSNYRVRVSPASELSARLWRINRRAVLADRPMANQELAVRLIDLSCGGIGLIVENSAEQPAHISTEDRLRVELTFKDGKHLLIEGRLRAGPLQSLEGGRLRTGVQFKQLQQDMEGRQISTQLTQIIGELQREEVRRMRLGLMAG